MNRYFILVGLSLFLGFNALLTMAQDYQYTYDATGNRVKREVINMSRKQFEKRPDSTIVSDNLQDEWDENFSESDLDNFTIKVYPNPTQGLLAVEVIGDIQITNQQLTVFDAGGKVVLQKNGVSTYQQLDISHVKAGNYILKLIINNQPKEWVIIKD